MCLKTFYKLKGSRPVTRPQLVHDSLEQCADTVTQKLVSYTSQVERYVNDCDIGQWFVCLCVKGAGNQTLGEST